MEPRSVPDSGRSRKERGYFTAAHTESDIEDINMRAEHSTYHDRHQVLATPNLMSDSPRSTESSIMHMRYSEPLTGSDDDTIRNDNSSTPAAVRDPYQHGIRMRHDRVQSHNHHATHHSHAQQPTAPVTVEHNHDHNHAGFGVAYHSQDESRRPRQSPNSGHSGQRRLRRKKHRFHARTVPAPVPPPIQHTHHHHRHRSDYDADDEELRHYRSFTNCEIFTEVEPHHLHFPPFHSSHTEVRQISVAEDIRRGHSFPFVSVSQNGLLNVDPKSISFENGKIAVLVAKPGKYSVSVKQFKAHENVTMLENGRMYTFCREPYDHETKHVKGDTRHSHSWVEAPGSPETQRRLEFNHENDDRDLPCCILQRASPSAHLEQETELERKNQTQSGRVQTTVDETIASFAQRRHAEQSKSTSGVTSHNHNRESGEWMELTPENERIGAAILIQSTVREWLARRWYNRIRSAAITIQIAYRMHRARQHEHAWKRASKRVKLALAFFKSSAMDGKPVRNLKLDGCDSVILLGGNNPIRGPGQFNTAQEIFQLHPLENVWSKVGQLPEPRVQGGAVLYSGHIIFFGGADPRYKTSLDKNMPCGTTWCLKVSGGNWRRLANMHTPRSNFGYILCQKKIWVFGGIDKEGYALSTCEMYDPETNTWTDTCRMDGPRLGVAVAKYGDKIWLIGGLTKNPKVPLLKSVIVYHVNHNIYTPAPAFMYPRAFATATTFYTKIFLFAGAGKMGASKSRSLRDVSIYENGHWEGIGQLRTTRHGHCQLRLGKYVLILGGINSQTQDPLDTCEVFNMSKYTLSTKVAPLPRPVVGCSGIVI